MLTGAFWISVSAWRSGVCVWEERERGGDDNGKLMVGGVYVPENRERDKRVETTNQPMRTDT